LHNGAETEQRIHKLLHYDKPQASFRKESIEPVARLSAGIVDRKARTECICCIVRSLLAELI